MSIQDWRYDQGTKHWTYLCAEAEVFPTADGQWRAVLEGENLGDFIGEQSAMWAIEKTVMDRRDLWP